MGIRVGMPIIKLSKNAKATKRKGDAKKIACEALSERYTKDKDIDRSRSHLNMYTGFKTGKELYKYWVDEAEAATDANGRKIKSNAVIGYQLIIKPDMAGMESLSDGQQLRFVQDGIQVASEILTEHGLQVDATAIHRDEMNPHGQVLGHDPEYTAGKKIDIRLYGAFNREFPKRMRQLGYDVEDLTVYEPDKAAKMTESQKDSYKADVMERKRGKKTGQSSNAYKAEKLAEQERAIQAEKQAIEARKLEMAQLEAENTALLTFMSRYKINGVNMVEAYKRELEEAQKPQKAPEPPKKPKTENKPPEQPKPPKTANTTSQRVSQKPTDEEIARKRFKEAAEKPQWSWLEHMGDEFDEIYSEEERAEMEKRLADDPAMAEIVNQSIKSDYGLDL